MKSDCAMASSGLDGVLEVQRVGSGPGDPGGDGVRKTTSSFEITLSGSNGTNPEPLNPPRMFDFVIDARNATWEA